MSPVHRKRKQITLSIDSVQYEVQVRNCIVLNNTEDGERQFTYGDGDGGPGEFREEADPDYALEIEYFVDWSEDGISWALSQLDGQVVDFEFTDYPDVPAWTVTWSGQIKVKAPNAGGEVRATDMQTVTYPIIGKPDGPTRPNGNGGEG